MQHIVGVDEAIIREFRNSWVPTHPLILSGREVPLPVAPSLSDAAEITGKGTKRCREDQQNNPAVIATGNSSVVNSSSTSSSVDAARLRYLARKK